MNYKIDNLQYCNWSRKIFEINRSAGLDAVHVTIVYHEDFDELQLEIKKWEKLFQENSDLIFPGKNFQDIEVLNKSFNISRGSKKTAETIEVKIEDGQFCGYGECVPYNRYKETIESVSNEIDSIKGKIEDCIIDTSNLSNFIKNGAARNAIDCALWDLNCKKNNSTIWELMKIEKPHQLPGSYTVVLDEPEKMLEDVSKHKEFPTIKLKVNADNLEKILTKTRDLIPNQKIIIDKNNEVNEPIFIDLSLIHI